MPSSRTQALKHPTAPKARGASPNLIHVRPQPLLDPIQNVSRETISWKRKVFHILGVGCVGVTYGFSSVSAWQAFTILAGVAVIFCGLDLLRFRVPALNKRIRRDFGPYMRNYELNRLSGSSWFLLAGLITIASFSREAAALAFIYLALGDPLASWVGVRWGRVRLPGGKSLEGSLTLTLTCFLAGTVALATMVALGGGGVLAGASLPTVLIAAAVSAVFAAFAEWLPIKGVDDNFLMPVVTAALISLCFPFLA